VEKEKKKLPERKREKSQRESQVRERVLGEKGRESHPGRRPSLEGRRTGADNDLH
jgi:hypothetical protein